MGKLPVRGCAVNGGDGLRARVAFGVSVLIVSYDRSALGQTGSGHFSPVGGYHPARDLALILDVARFKYPPHSGSVERLWAAIHSVDPAAAAHAGKLTSRMGLQELRASTISSTERSP